jgi:hypothetical protein
MTQVKAASILSVAIAAALCATATRAADAPATPTAPAATAAPAAPAATAAPAAPAATAAPAAAADAAAPATDSLVAALTGGKVHFDFRYRYEQVDQQGFDLDAYASTLRTRLNYTTAEWQGLTAMLEASNVLVIGQYDLYNSTTNGSTDRPVVADPRYTDISQAWLQFKKGSFTGIGGRQIINLDNQRFVGNVGWRQNGQTYDAVTLKLGAIPRTQLFYSWVGNVNRVTGPDNGASPSDLSGNTNLVNARVDLGPVGSLVLFGYWLGFDKDSPYSAALTNNLSSNSYGLRYTGAYKFSEAVKLDWAGSYAHQTDDGDSTLDYSADYYLVEGALGVRNFGIKAGYEVLGGNTKANTTGFQTPLATLHAFQGWADKFLSTPQAGVEDFYVGGSANFGGFALQLVYHDFQAEAVSRDYGTEWDASVAYKFAKRYEAMLKYANYSASNEATGTQASDASKTWLQFTASF